MRSVTSLLLGAAALGAVVISVAALQAAHPPQWPQAGSSYEIVWDWRMQYPDSDVFAEGPMIWRGDGSGAVFFHIEPLAFKQLQINGTVFNWHTSDPDHPNCYAWHVPYALNVHWFDNATLAYTTQVASAVRNAALRDEQTWLGALSTPASPLGVPYVSFVATIDPSAPANVSRIPTRYSPVAILRPMPPPANRTAPTTPANLHRGSEILIRKSVAFGPQDPADFVLPEFCNNARIIDAVLST